VNFILNSPQLVLVLSFLALWSSEWVGSFIRKRYPNLEGDQREDFNLIAAATLTLLGLIIGFSFSMAITRYDQRKDYEEAEANAIGTEYVRADLLPEPDATAVRALLISYVDRRISFYLSRGDGPLLRIDADTARLQDQLWTAVQAPALAQPTPVIALAVGGMNDVLNSQGRTQAAWWNRIPDAAWGLMAIIALCSNLLIGYGVRCTETKALLFLMLPLVVSISFFLISDIDSPRHGMIRVRPQNLENLAQFLHAHGS
jgi:hypothetical protein